MTVTIKPSDKAITTYYEEMQKYKELGVSKETSVRPAFLDLLKEVAKVGYRKKTTNTVHSWV